MSEATTSTASQKTKTTGSSPSTKTAAATTTTTATTTMLTTYSKDEINSWNYWQLQKHCRDAGLALNGTTGEVRKRFYEWWSKQLKDSYYTPERIQSMPYREIQSECRTAGLVSGGSTEDLRKRLLDWIEGQLGENDNDNEDKDKDEEDEQKPPPTKKQKKDPAEDLICPITWELPFCPVYAEDGIIYEKAAIEKHFETKRKAGEQIKSPITRKVLTSTRLFPAPQIKNLIVTLIENGSITGPLAESWLAQAKQKKEMEAMIKKAEHGNVKMMRIVALYYQNGEKGFEKDFYKSFGWYEKASEAGCVLSMAVRGDSLFKGQGVAIDERAGVMYLSLAAGRGSAFGAFQLAKILAVGLGFRCFSAGKNSGSWTPWLANQQGRSQTFTSTSSGRQVWTAGLIRTW